MYYSVPVWHVSPVYPATHKHVKFVVPFTQVPSYAHGSKTHASYTASATGYVLWKCHGEAHKREHNPRGIGFKSTFAVCSLITQWTVAGVAIDLISTCSGVTGIWRTLVKICRKDSVYTISWLDISIALNRMGVSADCPVIKPTIDPITNFHETISQIICYHFHSYPDSYCVVPINVSHDMMSALCLSITGIYNTLKYPICWFDL